MYSFACVCVSMFVLSGVIWPEEMGHFIRTFVSEKQRKTSGVLI